MQRTRRRMANQLVRLQQRQLCGASFTPTFRCANGQVRLFSTHSRCDGWPCQGEENANDDGEPRPVASQGEAAFVRHARVKSFTAEISQPIWPSSALIELLLSGCLTDARQRGRLVAAALVASLKPMSKGV